MKVIVSENPLLSVIVAVYNIEAYLPRCVDSICAQSYKNLEIILVDDGATDNSGKLCDDYGKKDERIKVVHKKNGGLSDARNAGTAIATGELIAFVDGDDWIEPAMYEKMITAMAEQQADIAICRYKSIYAGRVEDDSGNRLVVLEGREALAKFIEEDESLQIQNAAWNKVYRRALIEEQEQGEIKQEKLRFPVGRWYEDIVYTAVLLSRVKRGVYLDEALYNYVIEREGSIMSVGINARTLTDQIPAYLERSAFLQSIGEEELAEIHDYYMLKRMLLMYTQFSRLKNPGEKRKYCKELRQMILEQKERFAGAFSCRAANPNEKKKMDIFIKSPWLYNRVIRLNEEIIVPWKQRRIARRETEHLFIVKLSGGLGNQMFQYSLYRKLESLGKKVKIDDVTEYLGENTRPKQLAEAFSIFYERCTKEELTAMTDAYKSLFSRIRRKLTGRRTKSYMEKQFNFDEKVFQLDSAYLEGCWQTAGYFQGIEKELHTAFTFSHEIPKETQTFLEQIEREHEAVSIHIRRGDYLIGTQEAIYGNICTDDYYKRSVERIREKTENPHFFIFTNDISWAKKTIQGSEYTIVDCNDEQTGYLDMLLMSRCKHNIIANSSFSWWAAWLNENPGKIVIAPGKWLNDRDCSDIYMGYMTVMEVQ